MDLVPFLIPPYTNAALEHLADPDIRAQCDVSLENRYLFPSTQQSFDHIYGWYAVNKVCTAAGIQNPSLLTATKQRHRVIYTNSNYVALSRTLLVVVLVKTP